MFPQPLDAILSLDCVLPSLCLHPSILSLLLLELLLGCLRFPRFLLSPLSLATCHICDLFLLVLFPLYDLLCSSIIDGCSIVDHDPASFPPSWPSITHIATLLPNLACRSILSTIHMLIQRDTSTRLAFQKCLYRRLCPPTLLHFRLAIPILPL